MFGTCCAFYCPKATVLAASDVTTVYGVTPSLPIRSHDQYLRNLQQPNSLQDRFERDCRGKTRNIASPVVLRQFFRNKLHVFDAQCFTISFRYAK